MGLALLLPACRDRVGPPGAVARGNEPFWGVSVTDSGIVYRTPEQPAGEVFRPTAFTEGDRMRTYRGENSGGTIVLTLEKRPCTDSMSGEEFEWMARAELGTINLEGCATTSLR